MGTPPLNSKYVTSTCLRFRCGGGSHGRKYARAELTKRAITRASGRGMSVLVLNAGPDRAPPSRANGREPSGRSRSARGV